MAERSRGKGRRVRTDRWPPIGKWITPERLEVSSDFRGVVTWCQVHGIEHAGVTCYFCLMDRVRLVDEHLAVRSPRPARPDAPIWRRTPLEIDVVEVTRKFAQPSAFPSIVPLPSRRKGDGIMRDAVPGSDF